MITVKEFQKKVNEETGITPCTATIIKYMQSNGAKKIAGKWVCEESVLDLFMGGKNNG